MMHLDGVQGKTGSLTLHYARHACHVLYFNKRFWSILLLKTTPCSQEKGARLDLKICSFKLETSILRREQSLR